MPSHTITYVHISIWLAPSRVSFALAILIYGCLVIIFLSHLSYSFPYLVLINMQREGDIVAFYFKYIYKQISLNFIYMHIVKTRDGIYTEKKCVQELSVQSAIFNLIRV